MLILKKKIKALYNFQRHRYSQKKILIYKSFSE